MLMAMKFIESLYQVIYVLLMMSSLLARLPCQVFMIDVLQMVDCLGMPMAAV